MSDELILDVSFDNQTVTDATENWTLSGTPNVTYEQISGGSGYSLVTGKLGTPPTLVAVDQEAIYNEYTIDFNLYVKPSYTDAGWFSFFSLYAGMNYSGDYRASVYNGLTISLEIGGSRTEVTIDSPTGRWIHITIISEYDSDTGAYTAYLYVDSVLRTYEQGSRLNGSPFAIGKKLVLFNRGSSSFFLPNTPGLAMDNLTVIAGIHVPNQTPAISLPNLSRVFQNFCTWISSQLSAVAKSGSYNDLSDKPTISTVNNGTLTIQKNGVNVQTFTANQSTNATANITVPTKTSDLTNDSGFITSDSTKIPLAGTNALSGSIIPSTDNAYDLGSNSYSFKRIFMQYLQGNNAKKELSIFSSNDIYEPWDRGAWINLYTNDYSAAAERAGTFRLEAVGLNNTSATLIGTPSGTLTWGGQPIQYGSDQRLKQQITEIDNALLDAWEDVNLVQFKYNDAVDQKGDNARLHTGYVVQQIDNACKKHGVDVSAYGLYCHEEYPEETEEVEVEQADGTKVKETKVIREASEHYSLRYTEVYAVECMYLRRCVERLVARIEQLEKEREAGK